MRSAFWLLCCCGLALPAQAGADGLASFIRADANADGEVDLSDSVAILSLLFLGGTNVPCLEAADVSDDGVLDLTDAIRLLSFLFLGGEKPYWPYPQCGYALEDEQPHLSCESFPFCQPAKDMAFDKNTIEVAPEMFDGLRLLAEGEPLEALKNVPGYEKFHANLVARPGGGEYGRNFAPTIIVTANEAHLDLMAEDIIDMVETKLASAGIDAGYHVRGIYPREIALPTSLFDILVYLEDEFGQGHLRGGRVILGDDSGTPLGAEVTPPKKCSGDIQCYWSGTIQIQPSAPEEENKERVWNHNGHITHDDDSHFHGAWPREKGGGADGWHKKNGFGPWHELVGVRHSKNSCVGPETDIALLGRGIIYAQANVYCQDNGVSCDAPDDCASTVWGAASYTSSVKTQANSFDQCPKAVSSVRLWALDSAIFDVNDSNIFLKSLEIKNETIPLDSPERAGLRERDRGLAGDADYTEGHEQILAEGGKREEDLVAYGAATVDTPVNFNFVGLGEATVSGSGNASGSIQIITGVLALYYAGKSDCPGAGTTHTGYVFGYDDGLRKRERDKAAEFMKRHADVTPNWLPSPKK